MNLNGKLWALGDGMSYRFTKCNECAVQVQAVDRGGS